MNQKSSVAQTPKSVRWVLTSDKGGSNKLLINLEGVDFISSAGLRSILVAAKLLKNSNGQIRICGANESVRKVLETSGFTSLVALYTDESEALAAFT